MIGSTLKGQKKLVLELTSGVSDAFSSSEIVAVFERVSSVVTWEVYLGDYLNEVTVTMTVNRMAVEDMQTG